MQREQHTIVGKNLYLEFLFHQSQNLHTQLNDLPSRGFDLIDLAADILPEGLMPWQKFALEHTHKYKPDGRWATPTNCIVVARQNGKSFLQQIRILGGLFLWDEQDIEEPRLITDKIDVTALALATITSERERN